MLCHFSKHTPLTSEEWPMCAFSIEESLKGLSFGQILLYSLYSLWSFQSVRVSSNIKSSFENDFEIHSETVVKMCYPTFHGNLYKYYITIGSQNTKTYLLNTTREGFSNSNERRYHFKGWNTSQIQALSEDDLKKEWDCRGRMKNKV